MRTSPRGYWVWIFLCCWLVSSGAGAAWAKNNARLLDTPRALESDDEEPQKKAPKKTWKKQVKKGKKTDSEPPAAAKPKPAGIDDPQVLLQQARQQETAGDIAGCLLSLGKFINVYPLHPERAAILARMAQLAQARGQQEKALQIYALAASLYPDQPLAAEARWQVQNLEFLRNLRERDPLAVFKEYLLQVNSRGQKAAAEKLREPLRQGWLAVDRVLRSNSPCPVQLLEEALTLWELQPEGAQFPEAAVILGEILQENGLYGEARTWLQRALEQGSPEVRRRALVGLLEAAWAFRDLPDFALVWRQWRQNRGLITPDLKARLDKLPLPGELFTAAPGPVPETKTGERQPEEEAVAALLDWWSGKSPDPSRQGDLLKCLEHFLSRPLPQGVKERLLLQLAQLQWSQGHFPQAAKIYQELYKANTRTDNFSFYQDRLALSQLQARRPEAALEIYRVLSQEGDNFWQLVSRTRLADLEISRLQTEPPQ